MRMQVVAYTRMHMHVHACTCMYTYAHARTCMYMETHYARTYMYVDAQCGWVGTHSVNRLKIIGPSSFGITPALAENVGGYPTEPSPHKAPAGGPLLIPMRGTLGDRQ